VENVQYLGIGIAAIALAREPHGFGGAVSLVGERIREALRGRRRAQHDDYVGPALPPEEREPELVTT
jgi:hypothetical protein